MAGATNSLLLTLCLIATVTAASLPRLRFRRDGAEEEATPVSNYLPPEVDQSAISSAVPAAQLKESAAEDSVAVEAVPDSGALGANGYEYRTVHKLRYRQRRDVSHLNLGYLPPLDKPKPANVYLPPHPDVPTPSNEYLPPVQHEDVKSEPITEETVAPTEQPTVEEQPEEQQDTAIFGDDGYHYKRPAVAPNLGPAPETETEAEAEPAPEPQSEAEPELEPQTVPSAEPAPLVREYLPPLDNAVVVEAEGPDGENVAFNDNGYHYRAVKRARYF